MEFRLKEKTKVSVKIKKLEGGAQELFVKVLGVKANASAQI